MQLAREHSSLFNKRQCMHVSFHNSDFVSKKSIFPYFSDIKDISSGDIPNCFGMVYPFLCSLIIIIFFLIISFRGGVRYHLPRLLIDPYFPIRLHGSPLQGVEHLFNDHPIFGKHVSLACQPSCQHFVVSCFHANCRQSINISVCLDN